MPEALGLAGSCRSLFAQGTSAPAPGRREDTPSSAGLQWHYRLIRLMASQALSVGSVRLLKGNKTSIDGQLPGQG
jgi:hypothetical protein